DMVTWATGLDRRGVPQGRREPKVDEATFICPNFFGSRSWNQATFSPTTGLIYNMGIEWCGEFTGRKQQMTPGKPWLGGTMTLVPITTTPPPSTNAYPTTGSPPPTP